MGWVASKDSFLGAPGWLRALSGSGVQAPCGEERLLKKTKRGPRALWCHCRGHTCADHSHIQSPTRRGQAGEPGSGENSPLPPSTLPAPLHSLICQGGASISSHPASTGFPTSAPSGLLTTCPLVLAPASPEKSLLCARQAASCPRPGPRTPVPRSPRTHAFRRPSVVDAAETALTPQRRGHPAKCCPRLFGRVLPAV